MILLIDSGFLPWGAKMHHKWLGSWLAKRRLPQDVVAFLLANDCWKLFSSQMIAGRQTIGKRCALKTANELFTGDNAMQSAATDLTDFKVQKSWSAWLMKNWPLWEHPTPCGKRCALKKAYELFTGDNAMQSAATDLTDFKVPKSWSAWRMKNRPLWEHPTPSLHWKWSYESPKILICLAHEKSTPLGAPDAVTPLEMKLWKHDGSWHKGWAHSMIAACRWRQQFITEKLFHRWPRTSNPTWAPATIVVWTSKIVDGACMLLESVYEVVWALHNHKQCKMRIV